MHRVVDHLLPHSQVRRENEEAKRGESTQITLFKMAAIYISLALTAVQTRCIHRHGKRPNGNAGHPGNSCGLMKEPLDDDE